MLRLQCDRWIASSVLQKSIRRGEVELAQRAACTIHAFDRNAIWRRLIAISCEDVGAGAIDALLETFLAATSSDVRQQCGEAAVLRAERRAAALTTEQIAVIVASLGDSVRDARDRALLLIGFAGAFRRSELSGIDCKSIDRSALGIVITISRSKTDQEGQTRQIAIPRGQNRTCPVQALDQWLRLSGISEGPASHPVRAGPARPIIGGLHRVDRQGRGICECSARHVVAGAAGPTDAALLSHDTRAVSTRFKAAQSAS